jgi:hypothetical protein
MQPPANPTSPPEPQKGLPPVVPPTGGFLAQLFLVPGLIVTVVVLLLLAANWLILGTQTPTQFLANLDNPNPEVRWRTAADLAQVLRRDDTLAADPRFALELAKRLQQTLDESADEEAKLAERLKGQDLDRKEAERQAGDALVTTRGYVIYLMACLSNCTAPVGVPVFKQVASRQDGMEPLALAQRRQQALWALANQGETFKRFDKYPKKDEELSVLREEADGPDPERGQRARTALALLQARRDERPRLLGLEEAFDTCGHDGDPNLRKMTAFALNFWEGSPEENAHVDGLLAELCADDGRTPKGTDAAQALDVRYNAAVALARHGSERARVDLLAEMLDEDRLRQNLRIKPEGGPEGPDEEAVEKTLVNGLKAIAELHRRQPGRDLSSLKEPVGKLTQDSLAVVRGEAERTQKELGWK